MFISLENQWDLAADPSRSRLQKAQRGGIGIAAGVHRQLEMVVGVVPGRIGGKTPCRPVLKSLVHGQYDEAPGTTQPPMVQQSGQVRAGAGRVALVPAQDLGDAV